MYEINGANPVEKYLLIATGTSAGDGSVTATHWSDNCGLGREGTSFSLDRPRGVPLRRAARPLRRVPPPVG
jgi:hypothetical protein